MSTTPDEERPVSSYIDGFILARRYSRASAGLRGSACRRFCTAIGDPPPSEITPVMCLDWWSGLTDLAPASVHAYLMSVRQFFEHLRDMELMHKDPLRVIRAPKLPRSSPKTFTPEEVDRILAACRNTRDVCIVTLMVGAGLRSIDVARLQVDDIDFDSETMVIHGKGGHRDTVPMSSHVIAAIRGYLEEVPVATGALLRNTYNGGPLSVVTIQHDVNRFVLPLAGLDGGTRQGQSAHALRRTFATALLESGATIREVQVLLRHQSLATTEKYLQRYEAAELRSVVELGPLHGR